MRIETLYGRHQGEDVYVVGTGPSLRCFPLGLLCDMTTIGLNQAWKHLATTYALTVHPDLLRAFLDDPNLAKPRPAWLVKKKAPMGELDLDDPRFHVFHTSPDLKTVAARTADTLYIGEGAQCTAIDLACRMGARTVILVGCDMCQVGADHHAHDQHVRFLGLAPAAQYALYRKRTAQVRSVARTAHGVHVLTLSPFVGLAHPEEDYRRLAGELGLAKLPRPKDVSPYKRKKAK